jgi:hypothetical protein
MPKVSRKTAALQEYDTAIFQLLALLVMLIVIRQSAYARRQSLLEDEDDDGDVIQVGGLTSPYDTFIRHLTVTLTSLIDIRRDIEKAKYFSRPTSYLRRFSRSEKEQSLSHLMSTAEDLFRQLVRVLSLCHERLYRPLRCCYSFAWTKPIS